MFIVFAKGFKKNDLLNYRSLFKIHSIHFTENVFNCQMTIYLIVIILSPVLSFCLSMSICAPVNSRIALMLHPPLPITLEITVDGTETFFDLYKRTVLR